MDKSDALFRDLCENAHDLIQCVSPAGQLLYVNRAWLETLGYTADEVHALSVFDIIHPDSRAHCEAIFERLIGGESVARVEADFRCKDGSRVPVEGSVQTRREQGRLVSTQGIFRDMTLDRQTQEELDRLFDLSLDLLCVAGTDGYFKQINPAFETVLGYNREELMSRSFLDFVHPDDRESTLRQVEHLAQGRVVVDFQNRYRARDGGWRWLAWRSTPLVERGLIYAVARDITEHKRDQELLARQAEELARSNAELEQFAYVASHDLRGPLRSVHHLADWIEEALPTETPEKVKTDLTRLRQRVRRLETLVDDLLRYSRAGRAPGEIREVDVAALVAELTELFGPPEGFTIRHGPGLPVFRTDKTALEQVLRNLIGNAFKHHDGPPGELAVSARDRGDRYEFSVSDDGPGVPARYRERVFRMFYKLESRDRVEGTGLGLALVKRLVDAHGGRIWLDARKPRGLVVSFTWPKQMSDRPDASTTDHEQGGLDANDPDR